MDYKEFVKSTVNALQPDVFEQIKTVLIPEYRVLCTLGG